MKRYVVYFNKETKTISGDYAKVFSISAESPKQAKLKIRQYLFDTIKASERMDLYVKSIKTDTGYDFDKYMSLPSIYADKINLMQIEYVEI